MANLFQSFLIGLLLLILYRYISITLGISALGVWSVVLASASPSRLADLGLGTAVTKFVAGNLAKGDTKTAAKIIETSLIAVAIFSLIFFIAINPVLKYLMSKIFAGGDLEMALKLLPYALVSLWFILTSSIILSGFDGAQRMIERSLIVVAGQVFMLIASVLLVPNFGLIGLALAQLIQGVFLLVASWIFLRKFITTMPLLPHQFERQLFNQSFSYGINVQISGVVIMLFDPLTKILMGKFGGASAAGLFEIANQIVLKVRALIISANQAIVPKIAQISETTPSILADFYTRNMRVLIATMIMIYSLLIILIDPIANFILEVVPTSFYLIYYAILVGWFINTIAAPAYFFNLGIGDVKPNTHSHVFMGATNLFVGLIAGFYYGWHGVLFAYVFSLSCASLFLVIIFQKTHNINFKELNPSSNSNLLILISIALAINCFFGLLDYENSNFIIIFLKFIVPIVLIILGFIKSDLFDTFFKKQKKT